jgi:DNA-binding Lrp family transcriptional regulator
MKKSNKEINGNDKKILDAIIGNARQTAVELSNKTGLSRQTINKIINQLEKNQTIWGYNSIINLKVIGKKRFILLIKTSPGLTKEKFLKILPKEPHELFGIIGVKLTYVGITHGPFDRIVIFTADGIVQASKFMRLLKVKYKEFIDDIILIEELMTIRSCGIINPNYKEELDNIL